jgi:hypothetical protein
VRSTVWISRRKVGDIEERRFLQEFDTVALFNPALELGAIGCAAVPPVCQDSDPFPLRHIRARFKPN